MKNNNKLIALTAVSGLLSACAAMEAAERQSRIDYITKNCKELSAITGVAFAARMSGESFSEVASYLSHTDTRFYAGMAYDFPETYTREQAVETSFRACMMSTSDKN